MTFIFLAKILPVLHFVKNSFINWKCQNFTKSNSPCYFWHLTKNISNNFSSTSFPPLPPLFHPNGTTVINFLLRPLLRIQHWMVLKSSLPRLHLLDYIMPDVFFELSGPNPWRAYGPDGVFRCSQKLCFCACTLFGQTFLSHLLTSTFPSCWKFSYIQPVP